MDETKYIRDRQKTEAEYHDKRVKENKPTTSGVYGSGIQGKLIQRIRDLIGVPSGKRILDFGCGPYGICIDLAEEGAKTDGFDISEEFIMQGNETIKKKGLQDKVSLKVMTAENLDYPDNTFDFVVGNSILHHVDLTLATQEISRVLKKGGRAIFLEPLNHNPLINLYRRLTPNIRTPTEKPLSFSDLNIFQHSFSEITHEEHYLLALASLLFWYLTKNKKIFHFFLNCFITLDNILLKLFPFLKKYCWIIIFDMKK